MTTIILDCYTDEPAGLGVPPYLGTYPRYLAGMLKSRKEKYYYLTIDDLRLWKNYENKKVNPSPSQKTNIKIYNLTGQDTETILRTADRIMVILGIHTPGKYLTAVPGTLKEVDELLAGLPHEKTLTGPAVFGTQLYGGKKFEKVRKGLFHGTLSPQFSFKDIEKYAVAGAEVLKHIPDIRIMEIETSRGCQNVAGCSFCTEPLKNKLEFRSLEAIMAEVKVLYKQGARHFRLGKHACFYAYPFASELLKGIRKACPKLQVLHLDNVNPINVLTERGVRITKDVVKYCTSGNVAAFGVETFDETLFKANTLNITPKQAFEAIKILNKYGQERGEDGLPKFLPGINIMFGLINETKETNKKNLYWLKKILDEGLLLRRINIRQASVFPGTQLEQEAGTKFLKKNKKYYWSWRKAIRTEIDYPMLQRIAPKGTILTNVYTELYDGNTTFGRQFGSYPLTIGIKGRLPLKQFIDVEVTGHMLRSVTAKVIT